MIYRYIGFKFQAAPGMEDQMKRTWKKNGPVLKRSLAGVVQRRGCLPLVSRK